MKLSVLFICNRSKINKKGFCPMKCRITYNKKRREFTTGVFINPNHWGSKKQMLLKKVENSKIVNSKLSLTIQLIVKAIYLLRELINDQKNS
ncbi:Arm DNA-binding domain-containing protein [Tenacibaculum aiptasiae]|nr:Arm DNA-binding domain-containing protein [Tenacibaculum aiptasiae]